MVNPFKEINWNPSPAECRKFAKSLIIGFPCVALVMFVGGYVAGKGWNVPLALKVAAFGVAVGLVFLSVPAIAKPFYVAWYGVACCVGLVIGNILLVIVFYVLITGIGLLRRAFSRQLIRKTPDDQAASYWQNADQPNDPKRYYSQF